MWSHFSDGLLFRYILNGHWLALGWFVERFKSKQTHTDCKRTIAALWLVGWDNNDYGWVLKGQWGLAAVAAEISSVFVEVSHMAKIARDFRLEVKSDYCKNNGKSKFAVGHKRQIVASPSRMRKEVAICWWHFQWIFCLEWPFLCLQQLKLHSLSVQQQQTSSSFWLRFKTHIKQGKEIHIRKRIYSLAFHSHSSTGSAAIMHSRKKGKSKVQQQFKFQVEMEMDGIR